MGDKHRGSLVGYGKGCRCDGCIVAMTAGHGKQSGYSHGKCRCEACSEAQRQYDAKIYDPVKVQQRNRARYLKNRERIRREEKERRAANPEAAREEDHRQYAKNRERRAQAKRDARAANPEHARAINREWRARTDMGRVHSANRRARVRNAFVEEVDPKVVFEQDDYVCQCCGIQCPKDAKWPRRDAATLDHIVAIANGGEHSYANVQTLCFFCNTSKGARPQALPVS